MANIPHVIHYCWFGDNPLGEEELRCIDSWRKFFTGYEIRCWDESNFDVRCCDYVSEAYDAKKWAFVSDYARFKILYDMGGIYFDTDVEVIRPMDDIVAAGPFMGVETGEPRPGIDRGDFIPMVAPGLGLAAQPGSDLYAEILASYNRDHFCRPDGTFDQTTVVRRTTKILQTHGYSGGDGVQRVAGVNVYPSDYFNPKDYLTGEIAITENTRTIHHFSASWFTPSQKMERAVEMALLKRGLSYDAAHTLAKWYATIHYLDFERVARKLRKVIHGG